MPAAELFDVIAGVDADLQDHFIIELICDIRNDARIRDAAIEAIQAIEGCTRDRADFIVAFDTMYMVSFARIVIVDTMAFLAYAGTDKAQLRPGRLQDAAWHIMRNEELPYGSICNALHPGMIIVHMGRFKAGTPAADAAQHTCRILDAAGFEVHPELWLGASAICVGHIRPAA